jgi:hypothetical protein
LKKLFTGYFQPSEQEFAQLWRDCVFAFDANVLLDLYRSTLDTQTVFFTILEKIANRIFLPHQAAFEYLENRLSVISIRTESYGKIKAESQKLTKTIESLVQEHALTPEIASKAKEASNAIAALVEAAAKQDPDLLHSDDLLDRIATLFEAKTGAPYDQARLKEIYTQAAQRYAQGIPPGYKDDKKGEPHKYGDVVIWLQLLDQARIKKKPIIFITGDVKEDWWLQHKGETRGPRPELRQEMMANAGVDFYMYTTQRFLEFAKQFLRLTLDTTKAESEFEKIEKQAKEAASQKTTITINLDDSLLQNWNTFRAWQPQTPSWLTSNAVNLGWQDIHPQLLFHLPLNRYVFPTANGNWTCEILTYPSAFFGEHAYELKFQLQGQPQTVKVLRLLISADGLQNSLGGQYEKLILAEITKWLAGDERSGQIIVMP